MMVVQFQALGEHVELHIADDGVAEWRAESDEVTATLMDLLPPNAGWTATPSEPWPGPLLKEAESLFGIGPLVALGGPYGHDPGRDTVY